MAGPTGVEDVGNRQSGAGALLKTYGGLPRTRVVLMWRPTIMANPLR